MLKHSILMFAAFSASLSQPLFAADIIYGPELPITNELEQTGSIEEQLGQQLRQQSRMHSSDMGDMGTGSMEHAQDGSHSGEQMRHQYRKGGGNH